jgi:hypothetical protein
MNDIVSDNGHEQLVIMSDSETATNEKQRVSMNSI